MGSEENSQKGMALDDLKLGIRSPNTGPASKNRSRRGLRVTILALDILLAAASDEQVPTGRGGIGETMGD